MSRAGSLCRDLSTSFKRNKNQLWNYMITDPARLSWLSCIMGSRLEIFQLITLAGQPGEWTKRRNRAAGNQLLMRIILWVVLSRSLRVKALEFVAFVVRVWENTTSSLNLSLSQQENTQTLGAARFKPSAAQTVKALEFAALVVCVWENTT